jgi:hypothetical protein
MADWTSHKRWDWIISGLNVNCWEGDPNVFLQATRNSNPVEASGSQSNRLGTQQNLLAAILEYVL